MAKKKEENLIEFKDNQNVFNDLVIGYKKEDGSLVKEYELREIVGKDEELINANSKTPLAKAKAIMTLLARCCRRIGDVTPNDFNTFKEWEELIKNLYVYDLDIMLMNLRRISVSEFFDVAHTCPKCNSNLNSEIPMEEVKIIPFNGVFEIPFELKVGYKDSKGNLHKSGKIRLPKGIDREILISVGNNASKSQSMLITRLCKFDDGYPISEDVAQNLIKKDRDYLAILLAKDNMCGIDIEVDIDCPNCYHTFKGLLSLANFI